METGGRGSIAIFSSYRPPAPLDIYSCQVEHSNVDEFQMTDGKSYNYNGQAIPSAALKMLISFCHPFVHLYGASDVDSGCLTGMIFVSERDNLETLHIALRFNDCAPKIASLADVFGKSNLDFSGVRMEDSGCFAADNLIYVSTKEPATKGRQPWTAVYKTNLRTGKTNRLTPSGQADLSPSVSPSGKQMLVASFQRKGWEGANEDLKTDIFVMNIEKPFHRRMVVADGGWPTWGSENVIFFHRRVEKIWGVFRADISCGDVVSETLRVTPEEFHAMTPAALNATTVAVAAIRQKSNLEDVRVEEQYRHIEIFDTTRGPQHSIPVTRKIRGKADHFNPFVIDGGKGIGYHRCKTDLGIDIQFQNLDPPLHDVDLFRVSGVFPTFYIDGSKFAFVDNEFRSVFVADKEGLHLVYEADSPNCVFSPAWGQAAQNDTLYICVGPSFRETEIVDIYAIPNVSRRRRQTVRLTDGFNNAFPSSSPDGRRLVFRSARSDGFKNLYIMEDAEEGEFGDGRVALTRLTEGSWTDTHCQWSPTGNWIVFSSDRNKPEGADESNTGYFALFLVNADDRDVVVRVLGSGNDISGYVNHPFFSPDGRSIVMTSDLAAVSVDPISLPLLEHSVRPYGDIFIIDIDPNDINKNKDVTLATRITHSRYQNSTGTWFMPSNKDPNETWYLAIDIGNLLTATSPYAHRDDGGESWRMTGHLCVAKRGC